jgi:small subunit ribosomal protein S9
MERTHDIGRRKTSIARIYLKDGKGDIKVNGKAFADYFASVQAQNAVIKPFQIVGTEGKFDVQINVKGGGITGQSQASALAIAKALTQLNPEYRKPLKDENLLTRDPRMVERKKPGKKKARKSFQFSKR